MEIEDSGDLIIDMSSEDSDGDTHDGHWQVSNKTFHCVYSKAKEYVYKACVD